MQRRITLAHSLATFGFRSFSTHAFVSPTLDKSAELLQLRTALQECIDNRSLTGMSQSSLSQYIESFEIAAAMAMNAGDTIKSHLYTDCADACQMLRELETSRESVKKATELTRTSALCLLTTTSYGILLASDLTIPASLAFAAMTAIAVSKSNTVQASHLALREKHLVELKQTKMVITTEIAKDMNSAPVKNKM